LLLDKDTTNKAVRKWNQNDKLLFHDRITLGFFINIFEIMMNSTKLGSQIKTPYYLIQGKKDTLVNYKGPSKFYDETKIKDKTIALIHGKLN